MKKDILNFIQKNNFSPFSKNRSKINIIESPFKTRDAKSIHNKVISKISSCFVFPETANILSLFCFSKNEEEIKKRQSFFSEIKNSGKIENDFLKSIKIPRALWKPRYDITIVTEDSETFTKLKEKNCPIQMLISETDVSLLESKDVVQVLNCDEYNMALENLPQAVFLKNTEEAYLERHLEELSGWIENLEIIKKNVQDEEIQKIIKNLNPLIFLTKEEKEKITKDFVESKLEEINLKISEELKKKTISGDSLFDVLSKKILPNELKELVQKEIKNSGIPLGILNTEIPVTIDESELESYLRNQDINEFSNISRKINNFSEELLLIPEKIYYLKNFLLFLDFTAGISQFIDSETNFPLYSDEMHIKNSKNILIYNPQPISFYLSEKERCSILTGANSGGKTTLLEHIIQIISLFQMGLPVFGEISISNFTEIYYFAKNKGAPNKGAFENLLEQMSKINPGKKTLILADEIEAVTEPGVAGKIISATADYYIKKNCYLIIATHLGHEIKENLPEKTRIDGIEAKGLTENFDLIVDHNPILGRIAHSTPELIVEKMANSKKKDYFLYLNDWLKKN
jgi:DNA mismatch repair protein MutS2